MQGVRALPALDWRPLRWALWLAIAAVASANALLVIRVVTGGTPADWLNLTTVSGDPFSNPQWRWSPVAAWMTPSLTLIGLAAWRVLHFAALFLLRDVRLALLLVVSYPFWFDVVAGNLLAFVAVAGVLAVRGNRAATVATYALALLMPRPLVLPLVVYLAASQPWSRRWLLGLLLAHALLVLLSGLSPEWAARLIASGSEIGHPENIGASRWIGDWWLLLGIPLSIWLLRIGRPGLSGLALSPICSRTICCSRLLTSQANRCTSAAWEV